MARYCCGLKYCIFVAVNVQASPAQRASPGMQAETAPATLLQTRAD